jgi:hypothetical protein
MFGCDTTDNDSVDSIRQELFRVVSMRYNIANGI